MPYLSINDLTKIYDGCTVVDKVCIAIDKGTFLSLLGPSGCGKTTTLRLIAGLEKPDGGTIVVNNNEINNLPVYKRNIGMVFQSYALFPHMTVEQNIAYGLEQRGMPKAQIRTEVAEAIEMVRLSGYEKRKPKQLSGGQQQRVALARALVIKPSLLLLDESLSALDKKLRVEMQVELKEIQQRVGITTIFVTHDQEEALTLSDKIAVMRDGKIMQLDSPEKLYENPANTFVASFLGEANFFPGVICDKSGNVYRIRLENNETFLFPADKTIDVGQKCILSVRPEKINLHEQQPTGPNIKGKIKFITYAGNISIYRIETMGREIKVQQQNTASGDKFRNGDEVYLSWGGSNSLILND